MYRNLGMVAQRPRGNAYVQMVEGYTRFAKSDDFPKQ